MVNPKIIGEYTSVDNAAASVNEYLSAYENIKQSRKRLLDNLAKDYNEAHEVWEVATILKAVGNLISDYDIRVFLTMENDNDPCEYLFSLEECWTFWFKYYTNKEAIKKNIYLYYCGMYETRNETMFDGFRTNYGIFITDKDKLKLTFHSKNGAYFRTEFPRNNKTSNYYLSIIKTYNLSDNGTILPYRKIILETRGNNQRYYIALTKFHGPQYIFTKSEESNKYVLHYYGHKHRKFYKTRRKEWDSIRSELATIL